MCGLHGSCISFYFLTAAFFFPFFLESKLSEGPLMTLRGSCELLLLQNYFSKHVKWKTGLSERKVNKSVKDPEHINKMPEGFSELNFM